MSCVVNHYIKSFIMIKKHKKMKKKKSLNYGAQHLGNGRVKFYFTTIINFKLIASVISTAFILLFVVAFLFILICDIISFINMIWVIKYWALVAVCIALVICLILNIKWKNIKPPHLFRKK